MRVLVFTDYAYHRVDGRILAERAFAKFLGRLAASLDGMVLLGRLDLRAARGRYEIPPEVTFIALPFYESLAAPWTALRSMARAIGRYWGALGTVDVVWILGPHPLTLPFCLLAWLRRRPVILGVRQDFPAYMRSRHSSRRLLRPVGLALDGIQRGLACACRVVVVGPQIAAQYRHARGLLEITVSLVEEAEIVDVADGLGRDYDGVLTLLSVGRLEQEKNPMMLAALLAELDRRSPGSWRLEVCGEGELADPLRRQLSDIGLEDKVVFAGYRPFPELRDRYVRSHVLVSTSWTEGFPQVFVEAFAAGLPVVSTDVGGIREAAGDALMTVPPGDVEAMADAVAEVARDESQRRRLITSGVAYARAHTMNAEIRKLASFLGQREPG